MSYIKYEVHVHASGTKYWFLNGKLHREDGPAVERANGDKKWYINGKRHRENGPAIEWTDGTKNWYLKGERLTEAEWRSEVDAKSNSCDGKIVEIDGKKYELREVS